ncbi:MAG TPA: ABC transporter ATP-binding protein [Gemmatimonadaceae bacterium]|jgi:ATP-binding cassette subfamily B protein
MTASTVSFHEEEALGKAYDSRLMRRLLAFAAPYRALIAIALFFLMIAGGLQLVGPFLTQHVIDVAIPRHDYGAIRLAVILYGASLLLELVMSYGQTWFTALLGQNVMRDLRLQLFSHLQRLPIAFFDRNPAGRLITRVTSDVETLNELFTAGVVSGMGDLFTLLAISVAMLVTDWRLSLASFAVIPLVILVSFVFRIKVREAYRDIRTRLARINAFLQERLSGMRIVQLFGRQRDEARRFDELNRAHLDAHLRSITVYALYFPAIEILTSVALASLIVAGAARVEATTLTVGTVAAFLQLVRRFFQPLQDLSDKYNTLQTAMASSERIFNLLDTEPWVDVPNQEHLTYTRPRSVLVEFQNVWFAYDRPHAVAERTSAEPEWVLRDVSFLARPGETLAIVGHTGAGKTTIVSLLMRFYDPQRGRILVNGRDIRDMPVEQLRGLIGYVQQDIFLFAGDVASNIRLSAPLSDEQVEAAAGQVGADRIIRRLAHGYHQVLGERGASISVGERQLLSFARAVAADPALLILDEATSAVDSEVEAEIQQALRVLLAGRTTIAIAHRLSTIVDADDIIVMHHGEVVEHGTHDALLAIDGLYARLWRLQI